MSPRCCAPGILTSSPPCCGRSSSSLWKKWTFPLWSAAPSSPIRTRRTVPASRRCCAGEGLGPFSEAVVGAKRLKIAVRISSALSVLGSVIGLLLAFYLTFVSAWQSISPAQMVVFLAAWLVPTLLISNWVNRY